MGVEMKYIRSTWTGAAFEKSRLQVMLPSASDIRPTHEHFDTPSSMFSWMICRLWSPPQTVRDSGRYLKGVVADGLPMDAISCSKAGAMADWIFGRCRRRRRSYGARTETNRRN